MKTKILSLAFGLLITFALSAQRKISTNKLQVKQTKLGISTDSILVRDAKGNVKHVPQSTLKPNLTNYVTKNTANTITGNLTLQGNVVFAPGSLNFIETQDADFRYKKSIITNVTTSNHGGMFVNNDSNIQFYTPVNGNNSNFVFNTKGWSGTRTYTLPNKNIDVAGLEDILVNQIFTSGARATDAELNTRFPIVDYGVGTLAFQHTVSGVVTKNYLFIRFSDTNWFNISGTNN